MVETKRILKIEDIVELNPFEEAVETLHGERMLYIGETNGDTQTRYNFLKRESKGVIGKYSIDITFPGNVTLNSSGRIIEIICDGDYAHGFLFSSQQERGRFNEWDETLKGAGM